MQQNKQRLISKISHEWSVGNFPSHTNHPDCVFVHRRFILYSLPLWLCEIFFFSPRVKHPQSYISGQLFCYTLRMWEWHTHTSIYNTWQQAWPHKKKKYMALTYDFSPTLHRLKNFHLLWRALKTPWKSRVSPRRHSNNLRTIRLFSLIMQMKTGSRPVVCKHTANSCLKGINSVHTHTKLKCSYIMKSMFILFINYSYLKTSVFYLSVYFMWISLALANVKCLFSKEHGSDDISSSKWNGKTLKRSFPTRCPLSINS